MDIERLRLVDVTGPEKSEIIVFPRDATRNAFEDHLDRAIVEQFVAQTTLKTPMRRRRLVQFSSVLIDHAQFHRGVAWLEQNFLRLFRAIMDMLEVQACVSGHKKIAG